MKFKITILFLLLASQLTAKEIFVSPSGNDQGKGTQDSPLCKLFKSFGGSKEVCRERNGYRMV